MDSAVRNVFWGAGNLIVGGVLLWLIAPGLSNGWLVAELVVIGVACAALLGLAFSDPQRFGMRR